MGLLDDLYAPRWLLLTVQLSTLIHMRRAGMLTGTEHGIDARVGSACLPGIKI